MLLKLLGVQIILELCVEVLIALEYLAIYLKTLVPLCNVIFSTNNMYYYISKKSWCPLNFFAHAKSDDKINVLEFAKNDYFVAIWCMNKAHPNHMKYYFLVVLVIW